MAEKAAMAELMGSLITTSDKHATVIKELSSGLESSTRKVLVEISKRVRLVSKALKRIVNKLRGNDIGLAGSSLILDYNALCKETLEEISIFIEALEEVDSVYESTRKTAKVRPVLKKSRAAPLEHNLESLQLTLNLFIAAETYRSSSLHGDEALYECKDDLVERKQEVESDLEERQMSEVVRLALLAISNVEKQFNTPSNRSSLVRKSTKSTSSESSGEFFEAEVEQVLDHDSAGSIQRVRSMSLPYSHQKVTACIEDQSVPLELLDHKVISHALRVFGQTQFIQRKTLTFAETLLQQAAGDVEIHNTEDGQSLHSPKSPPGSLLTCESSDKMKDVDSDVESKKAYTKAQSLYIASSRQDSRQPQSATQNRSSLSIVRTQDTAEPSRFNRRGSRSLPCSPLELATRYAGRQFRIYSNERVPTLIDFARFEHIDLPEIIYETISPSLNYDAPRNRQFGAPPFGYHPPKSKTGTKIFGKSNSKDEFNPDFEEYVIKYAKWFSDQKRLSALKRHEYRLRLQSDEKVDILLSEWTTHLFPDDALRIVYLVPELMEQSMLKFRHKSRGHTWTFVKKEPYAKDLLLLCSTGRYELS